MKMTNLNNYLEEKFPHSDTIKDYLLDVLVSKHAIVAKETGDGYVVKDQEELLSYYTDRFITYKPIVYFIGNEDYIKIGESTDLDERVPTIMNQFPQEKVWLWKLSVMKAEKDWHLQFAALKSKGEFFYNTGKLREFIGGPIII